VDEWHTVDVNSTYHIWTPTRGVRLAAWRSVLQH